MRLVDANELKGHFPKDEDWDYPVNTNSRVVEIIDNAPTVDAVEVVRCKDCWNSEVIPKEMQNVGEWFCEYWCAEMNDDDYCSCGKRREDG